jgi:ATP-binding cassette, subfamily B, bacterial
MLIESLPRPLAVALEKREVLLTTASDLDVSGRPADRRLVVTPTALLVFDPAKPDHSLVELPFDAVEAWRASAEVGGGVLQARQSGGWIDVVRYSNSLADRFAKLTAKLEERRRTGTLTLNSEDETDQRRCKKCGLQLQLSNDICPSCVPRQAVFRRVLGMIRPYRGATLLLIGLVLGGLAVELAPPLLQQYLVDDVLKIGQEGAKDATLVGALLGLVVILAFVRVISSLLAGVKGIVCARVGASLTEDLRVKLVKKLNELSVGYYDKHQTGVLTNRVTHDTEAMHSLITHLTGGFAMQILQLVGVGAMLFWINPKLAFYMMLPAPLVIGGSWYFWKCIYPRYHRFWDSSGKQAGNLQGMLAGIRVVKAFGQQDREFERFQNTSNRLRNARVEVESAAAGFSGLMQLVFALGGLIVWYVGGKDVLGGTMTLGALMAFLAYVAMFYTPLSNLAQLTSWLGSFATASQRVFELLDTPVQVAEAVEPVRVPEMKGAIKFENVTFGYDRLRPVLKDVSFEIQPGEMVGIVGRSGSGKSTVVNLISRFYDADSGSVSIDGINVKAIAREDHTRQVGVVLQEPFLFRGTIFNNLVYGRPMSQPQEVVTASRAAHAHEFILKSQLGYETPVGERGAGLSGGERQRLSIARAMLYEPRVLILDEATSSVDTESEKAIQDALKGFVQGRTTIAIAHRLSTLRHANRIMVFDAGKLVEQGSHQQLMERGGLYANLVRIQTRLGGEDSLEKLLEAEQRTPAVVPSNDDSQAELQLQESPAAVAVLDPPANGGGEPPTPAVTPSILPPGEIPDDFWLEAINTEISLDEHGRMKVRTEDGEIYVGAFALRAFPASMPDRFISLRCADADGKEHEIGIISDLSQWPDHSQKMIRDALERRYRMREIERIHRIEEKQNHLYWQVDVKGMGRTSFVTRWQQNSAIDFGENGKLFSDLEDNLYLLRDQSKLSSRERSLYSRYVFW